MVVQIICDYVYKVVSFARNNVMLVFKFFEFHVVELLVTLLALSLLL
ncbi:3255_t:CDS:2 [Funneliformis geosporum]|nr:3255_t:CDS:2 [Funneliformis geosporum]